jgi:inner membrane protein
MRGQTHVMIALAGASIVPLFTSNYQFKDIPWWIIFIASILPDIDEEKSLISNPSKVLSKIIGKNFSSVIDVFIKILRLPIRIFSKHRGITHSIFWLLLCSIGIFYINQSLLIWFIWGYFSHLLADFITPLGIPAFWPISKSNFKLPLCKTGSLRESMIFVFSTLILILSCLTQLI